MTPKKFLTTLIPALCIASSTFAFPFVGENGNCDSCCSPEYSGNCDFFVNGSFIYWQANADGFNEVSFPFESSVLLGPYVTGAGAGNNVFIEPQYKPGFKVGIGFEDECNGWLTYAEWTRLHQRISQCFETTSGQAFILASFPYNVIGDRIQSKWKLNMDLLDLILAREISLGKCTLLQPFFGVRGAWFHQQVNLNLSSTPGSPWTTNTFIVDSIDATAIANSWGVGLRAGTYAEWLLGCGFRMDGKASFSLVYNRFTNLSYSAPGEIIATHTPVPISTRWNPQFSIVKPQAELGLGFGWSTCICSYLVDISATYDFNIFWDQNMLRAIPDSIINKSSASPTDLSYHGPTITASILF